jgi:glycosyltransferase involved in cell wall biosynthesis
VLNVADLWPDSAIQLGALRGRYQRKAAAALEQWTYRVSFAVTAVTRGIRDRLVEEKGVPAARVLFLPNGVDRETFKPLLPDEPLRARLGLQGKEVLLYAGTLGIAHGLKTALEAMRLVGRSRDDVVLLLVGDGSARSSLESAAARLGLQNVRFHPSVPPGEVARLYSIAFAGLASALDIPIAEGARSAKLAAIMGCGKPVIYSGRGEGPNLVESVGGGIVAPPGDPQALAAAIMQLVDDPTTAAEMGKKGLQYVTNAEAWDSLVADWLWRIERLATRARAAPR